MHKYILMSKLKWPKILKEVNMFSHQGSVAAMRFILTPGRMAFIQQTKTSNVHKCVW